MNLLRRTRRLPAVAAAVALAGLAGGAVALADNVHNDVVAGGNDTITAGGTATVNYHIAQTGAGNDGQAGCNAADGTPATVTINAPAGVTATPGSLSFSNCGTAARQAVVFSSNAPGSYPISVSVTDSGSSSTVGTYTTSHADFTLTVNAAVASDSTPPVITPTLLGTLGDNGWFTSDVALSWTTTDEESPISSTSGCGALSITADQDSTEYTCTATSAGGTSEKTVSIKRDATAPAVSVTGVTDGSTYTLGAAPAAGCSTTDSRSGVAIAASLSSSGGPVGSITATCSGASDNAGNVGSAAATYSVHYAFAGFFRPIDSGALNVAKAGSAIPAKFSLGGDQGLAILAAGSPSSRTITCDTNAPQDAVELTVTAGSSSLSYDTASDQYSYVWKTDKSWAGTCRQLTVALIDGTLHKAEFKLTK